MPALGYSCLHPGPAVHGVPVSLAPQHSQEVIAELGRPEQAALIAGNPIELPLRLDQTVLAFQRWEPDGRDAVMRVAAVGQAPIRT